MRRQPSPQLRFLRGFVVLVTVWCTGCSGFEPLLDAALNRAETGMVCASELSGPARSRQSSASSRETSAPTAPAISEHAASAAQRGFACGCSSCHSVTIATWSFTAIAVPPPSPAIATELPLVSVDRGPLLPPPERIVS